MLSAHARLIGGLVLLLGVSCMGQVNEPRSDPGPGVPPVGGTAPDAPARQSGDPGTPAPAATTPLPVCGTSRPGPSPLRRLTRFEYNNTVRDLLGDDSRPAEAFPGDEDTAGFDNDASAASVPRLLAEGYLAAAERIAAAAFKRDPKLLGCAPTDAAAEAGCARQFVDRVGARAFRRPITSAERDRLLGTFQGARAFVDFRTAMEVVLQTMLMSPQFLYRIEDGTTGPAQAGPVVQVTSWEMASRLSYFLWGGMPDDALFEAARQGKLATRPEIAAQARRMLKDARARAVVRHFYRSWLQLGQVGNQPKDAKLFPDFTAEIAVLLRHETDSFVEQVLFDGDGSLTTLLTSPQSKLNKTLARFYGLASGPASDSTFEPVSFDATKRAGLLTHASLMSQLATGDHTHPIARGVFVRKQLLCAAPPDPPPDIVAGDEAKLGPNATARERLAAHRNSPACSGCHALIDPIGFGLENFGADGRYRMTERDGARIDTSGEIVGSDAAGSFAGPVELVQRLSTSRDVRRCHVMTWFRFAQGRGATDDDLCAMSALDRVFAENRSNIPELLVALTQTDAFLTRTVSP